MNEHTILSRKSGMMAADMNGETVMMDIETGMYYNLGAVGGRIWELLETPMTSAQLVEHLVAEFDVSPQQCAKDMQPFLEKMLRKGLLIQK